MKATITKYKRFDEAPFEQERLICGINALIEVLNLPLSKIDFADRSIIAEKLSRLSTDECPPVTSLLYLNIKLQTLIETLTDDDEELIEKVFCICEEKYGTFLERGAYV